MDLTIQIVNIKRVPFNYANLKNVRRSNFHSHFKCKTFVKYL